mmetsp:Transcript_5428/g.8112  ORF Transcript_5428/g.8112 Transcript_5428/m.8112 type:complete len:136 (+) Transcript_5428:18-425(+)
MSDSEAVATINEYLENQLEDVNYQQIAERRLKVLDMDYQLTKAAKVDPVKTFEESVSPNQDWEADFQDDFGYYRCASESSDEELQEPQKPPKREINLSPEKIAKIKQTMNKLQIKHPLWAQSISDEQFLQILKNY